MGSKIFIMGARHGINGEVDMNQEEVVVENLFLLMGSNLQLVQEAPAGTIVGIGGLERYLIKTGTISTS